MKQETTTEVFLWDLDSFTPRMFVQLERDGFNVDMIPELKTVMVSKKFEVKKEVLR